MAGVLNKFGEYETHAFISNLKQLIRIELLYVPSIVTCTLLEGPPLKAGYFEEKGFL